MSAGSSSGSGAALLGLLRREGLSIHSGKSVWRGRPLEYDDAGRIVWAPKGARDTLRPTIIATTEHAGREAVAFVAELVIGEQAQLSEQWKHQVAEVFGIPPDEVDARIQVIRAPDRPEAAR